MPLCDICCISKFCHYALLAGPLRREFWQIAWEATFRPMLVDKSQIWRMFRLSRTPCTLFKRLETCKSSNKLPICSSHVNMSSQVNSLFQLSICFSVSSKSVLVDISVLIIYNLTAKIFRERERENAFLVKSQKIKHYFSFECI